MLTRQLLNRCLRLDTHSVIIKVRKLLEPVKLLKRAWPLLQQQVELEFGRHLMFVGESFR